ncbi:radical SAM family heme chaperone HemW [Candidatus Fermentibacteria bacterium]|nr:radical SAM family heme chaperone HemW [Candidatus Fermentibacteria bacterium]
MKAREVPPDAGLYVHVPFCRTKCAYCGFCSQTDLSPIDAYAESLAVEARLRAGQTFTTLYVGGGTPTVLPPELLARLLRGPDTPWPLTKDAEVTVEANPDDITTPLLETLRKNGANRLSIGVQSFRDDELRFLGRRHTASQARAAIHLAKDAGFTNIGIDLMYGFRGQRRERWRTTLDEALRWRPAHLSCYQLTIEPNTPLSRRPPSLIRSPEAKEYDFFLFTSRLLTDHGYEHYEVSNFALPGFRARHNALYWHHAPYCGLGPAAHSFDGRTRSWNVRSVEEYVARLSRNAVPMEESETLTDEQLALERVMLGMRTARGVPLSALTRYAGWEVTLERLQAGGFLVCGQDRVTVTLAGLAIADRLPLEFLP